jgi:DNA polymerase-3 subunit delta
VLLVGEAEAVRDAAIREIRERVLGGGPSDFNEDRFDLSSGADPAEIVSAARTAPVLAPGRLVRVRGLEDRRAARFLDPLLPLYLDDPVPTTCLLLEARRVDRRERWVKLVQERGELRSCAVPTRAAELRSWVESRMSSAGKRAASGAALALLEQVGPDPDRLATEIDKLVLYVGARREVGPEDVAEAAGGGRPRAIYELTDAIGRRDRPRALRILHELFVQGEPPLVLLAGISSHLRRMLRASECRPLDPATVQRRLGIHPYAAGKLVEQLRRTSPDRLRAALREASAADRALKGALPLRPARALERLVVDLMR